MPTLRPSIWFFSSLAISSQPAARAGEARVMAASRAKAAAGIVDLAFRFDVIVNAPRVILMRGLDPPAGPKHLRPGEGPRIHLKRTLREDGLPGQARQPRYSRQNR